MEKRKDYLDDSYRSAPEEAGPAHDPGAIRRLNLKDDAVSVVHSGETDLMPNQEAQEAFEEPYMNTTAGPSTEPFSPVPPDQYVGSSLNPDVDTLVPEEGEERSHLYATHTENPTDAAPAPITDDDNDYEVQQESAEQAGAAEAS